MKQQILDVANAILKPVHARVEPEWKVVGPVEYLEKYPTFRYAGEEVPFFLHPFNCGHHPATATERTVELALADRWLDKVGAANVTEVGAVTSYYWPGRVKRVVDPADPHPLVTEAKSLLDLDLRGTKVLCLSTLEHVGRADYGLPAQPELLHRALRKLFDECARFLVTVPTGYNADMDAVSFDGAFPADVTVRYVVRCSNTYFPPYWEETADKSLARRPYTRGRSETVVAFER